MRTRGINFVDRWTAVHLPNAMTDDPVAVSDLAEELMEAAEREGITAAEINEEVDSGDTRQSSHRPQSIPSRKA